MEISVRRTYQFVIKMDFTEGENLHLNLDQLFDEGAYNLPKQDQHRVSTFLNGLKHALAECKP